MPEISRRRFIRDASLSAAAVGTVAAAGPSLLGSVGNATEATTAATTAATASVGAASASVGADTAALANGGTILAHLLDAESGTFAVYFGTQEVTIQSPELAQKLASATR
jgi:hypothetical protein